MKSFSKRVASFAMAAAMVLSLAAVSPVDAQAAKKASITKKTSITAGKTYTYKIKNVTSKQYVKVTGITSGVTVKYNKKTVKKNSTKIKGGKTIALKVTAKDKIANYKATIKAQVYNKSNNKKVGSLLKTTSTVKCTKLAIKSVEPATLAGSHKYIVVNFNRALDKLDPSEVSIRNKATNMLVTVEKVALASNGKSATLTLLGDALTSGETFVEANTDYVLTVTQNKATAAMDFNFAAVIADGSVIATDSSKSTITVGYYSNGYHTGTFTVPTTISVDYQDILGRTVTFWYNKNHEITKLVVANETPVYGAFNVVSSNTTIVKTDDNYALDFVLKTDSKVKYKNNISSVGNIYATTQVGNGTVAVSGNGFDYVKMILNPNGTIRSYYAIPMTGVVLTESVTGQIVRESKTTSVSLDKYTIVKDGKTITINDIVKGDVVVYDSNKKFAEVYNEKVTGPITSVSSKTVTVDGKAYEWANAKYIKNDESKTLLGEDGEKMLVSYMNSKADATLFLNRAGKLKYVSGTESAVVTNTTEYVLAEDAGNYAVANKHYLSVNGSNGKDLLGDVALDGISFKVVSPNGVAYINEKEDSEQTWTTSGNAVSFDSVNWTNMTNPAAEIFAVSNNSAKLGTICTVGNIKKGSVLNVTRDSKTNAITAITVEVPTNYTVSGNEVFKAGLGKIAVSDNTAASIAWYSIGSSVPVYEIYKDGAKSLVSKTEYSAFAKSTDKDQAANVHVFLNDKKTAVTKIVIDNTSGNVYGVSADKKMTGVVTAVATSKIGGEHFTELEVVAANGDKKVFTSFTDGCKENLADLGDVVYVEYAVDGEKNTANVITPKSDVISGNACSGNDIRDNLVVVSDNRVTSDPETFSLETNAKIFVVAADGKSIKEISYSELQTMTNAVNCPGNFWMYVHKFSEGHTDLIVIKENYAQL